jgi:methyltransferase (TIGR00027 family)
MVECAGPGDALRSTIPMLWCLLMTGISRTSVWAALARAFGAREPDPHVRNPDFLAERLIGGAERSLLGDHPLVQAMLEPYEEGASKMEVMRAVRTLIPRTHFIDDRLGAAIREGARQVVILGAGFDTRAYRLTGLLANAFVYEVDHPATQSHKILRVREAIGSPPGNLTYVAVDFRHDDLGIQLESAGYRRDQKTLFIWEGVTMYLPAESIYATLRWIAGNSARGSNLVFDYTYATAIQVIANLDNYPIPPQMKQVIERFKQLMAGEPWIFGIPDRAEEDFLQGFGLKLRTVMGMNSEEAVRNYLTRADGSILGQMQATERQGYSILEAVVR